MYIHTLSNHCSIYSTIGICAVHRFMSISSYRLSQGLYKLLVEGYNKVVTDEFYLFHHTANHIHSDISHCLYNDSCQHESRIKSAPSAFTNPTLGVSKHGNSSMEREFLCLQSCLHFVFLYLKAGI